MGFKLIKNSNNYEELTILFSSLKLAKLHKVHTNKNKKVDIKLKN